MLPSSFSPSLHGIRMEQVRLFSFIVIQGSHFGMGDGVSAISGKRLVSERAGVYSKGTQFDLILLVEMRQSLSRPYGFSTRFAEDEKLRSLCLLDVACHHWTLLLAPLFMADIIQDLNRLFGRRSVMDIRESLPLFKYWDSLTLAALRMNELVYCHGEGGVPFGGFGGFHHHLPSCWSLTKLEIAWAFDQYVREVNEDALRPVTLSDSEVMDLEKVHSYAGPRESDALFDDMSLQTRNIWIVGTSSTARPHKKLRGAFSAEEVAILMPQEANILNLFENVGWIDESSPGRETTALTVEEDVYGPSTIPEVSRRPGNESIRVDDDIEGRAKTPSDQIENGADGRILEDIPSAEAESEKHHRMMNEVEARLSYLSLEKSRRDFEELQSKLQASMALVDKLRDQLAHLDSEQHKKKVVDDWHHDPIGKAEVALAYVKKIRGGLDLSANDDEVEHVAGAPMESSSIAATRSPPSPTPEPEIAEWCQGMQEELDALDLNDSWELVPSSS
uniref:Uncharacterized protein n=1 Tax=Asparagus officinalis TaxID=4686 RepID=Q2AAA3_ASPOF|nr:hypothetical protein 17.t00017 [Asparagus officinalis]